MTRLEDLASESLLEEANQRLAPWVTSALWAEDAETTEEAEDRIRAVLAEEATK